MLKQPIVTDSRNVLYGGHYYEKIFTEFFGILFVSMIFISSTPLVALAQEVDNSGTQEEIGLITAFIALIAFIVVTVFIYRLLYSNTAIIGTRQGVNYAIGRRLVIPTLCGGGAAWVVIKVLNFLSGILGIIIIIVAVVALAYAIYKFIIKKGTLNVTSNEQQA